jgi:hypothetical protein
MTNGGCLLTVTFYGSEKVVDHCCDSRNFCGRALGTNFAVRELQKASA